MPFIKTKVNCAITENQEMLLKARMGEAVSLIPSKNENYLLLEFEDNCRMWLRGGHASGIAYVEAAIFGNEDHEGFSAFASEVTRSFTEILGIPAENIYIKFEDIASWSVGGQFIDRRMFR